ncbi:MAG: hypothetical protein ABFD08_02610 [Syntrophomonas sp.]
MILMTYLIKINETGEKQIKTQKPVNAGKIELIDALVSYIRMVCSRAIMFKE